LANVHPVDYLLGLRGPLVGPKVRLFRPLGFVVAAGSLLPGKTAGVHALELTARRRTVKSERSERLIVTTSFSKVVLGSDRQET
jgi:hypothetical protein